jgi:rusticyanin
MGELFANAPGPRVSKAQAKQLGNEVPAGATLDRSTNTVTFASQSVHLAVVASTSMPAEDFKVAGLSNPTIVVPQGARVQVEFVNADLDMAHGFVVSAQGAESSAMPMMTTRPVFSGSALWFLGDPTSAGLHAASLSFTASEPGTYSYFCPLPGHAQKGMAGSFVVQAGPAS